jgi:collagen type VII alpha
MKKCRKFLFLAVLAGLTMAGLALPARADFEVKFSYGGATVTIDDTLGSVSVSGGASTAGATIIYGSGTVSIYNLTVSNTGSTGGFSVSATIADSNSPGAATAYIDNSSLQIKNQTGVAGNSTLTITTGDTGFTLPTGGPGTLTSTISATASGANAANAKVVFNSYIDTTNTQFGIPGTGSTPTITLNPIAPGTSGSGNSTATVGTTPVPYSLTQVGQYTLAYSTATSTGDKFTDGSSGTTLTSPAPAGLVLLLTGVPMLYLGARAARRRIAVAV